MVVKDFEFEVVTVSESIPDITVVDVAPTVVVVVGVVVVENVIVDCVAVVLDVVCVVTLAVTNIQSHKYKMD